MASETALSIMSDFIESAFKGVPGVSSVEVVYNEGKFTVSVTMIDFARNSRYAVYAKERSLLRHFPTFRFDFNVVEAPAPEVVQRTEPSPLEPVYKEWGRDTERLEWVARRGVRIQNEGTWFLVRDESNFIIGEDCDLRSAIDQAMECRK